MESEQGNGTRYRAFLSYNHKDRQQARWLHRRLESYRMPRRLAGRDGARGIVPARLSPIFRDREELPAAGDLSTEVRAALAASESLIVVCSPNAPASPWVAKEVRTFRELHPERPIFAAILEGEPAQCFPAGLSTAQIEPLAADLRPEGDGRRLGTLKLVAGIAGVGLDALVQRDAQRRIRRVTAVTLGALLMMLVTTALAIFAFTQRAEAERQRAEAEGLVEFMLTDLRERLKGVGRLDVLTAVNERALSHYEKQHVERLPIAALERRTRILRAMGEDDMKRGEIHRAARVFQEALRTTAILLASMPEDSNRLFQHAQSEYWMGYVAERRGEYATAEDRYDNYRTMAGRLTIADPVSPRAIGELAYAESNLGIVKQKMRKIPAEARPHFLRSLGWFEMASRLEPSRAEWRVEIADAYAWVASTYYAEKNLVLAKEAIENELARKLNLLSSDKENMEYRYSVAIAQRSLARVALESGDLRLAELATRDARLVIDKLLRVDPSNIVWLEQGARLFLDIARVRLRSGMRREAIEAIEKSKDLVRRASLRASPSVASLDEVSNTILRVARQAEETQSGESLWD